MNIFALAPTATPNLPAYAAAAPIGEAGFGATLEGLTATFGAPSTPQAGEPPLALAPAVEPRTSLALLSGTSSLAPPVAGTIAMPNATVAAPALPVGQAPGMAAEMIAPQPENALPAAAPAANEAMATPLPAVLPQVAPQPTNTADAPQSTADQAPPALAPQATLAQAQPVAAPPVKTEVQAADAPILAAASAEAAPLESAEEPEKATAKTESEDAQGVEEAKAELKVLPLPMPAAPASPMAEQKMQPAEAAAGSASAERSVTATKAGSSNGPDAGTAAPADSNAASPAPITTAASPEPAKSEKSFAAQVDASAPAAPKHEEAVVNGRPGQIGRELGLEIARRVSGGRDELTVRLSPEHLGRVEVKMSFDDGGAIRAIVSADSPAALDMLRRDAGDLGRALADAGVRSDGQSFTFDARSGGDGSRFGSRPNPWASHARTASDGAAGEEALTPEYRPLRSTGRIDLMA